MQSTVTLALIGRGRWGQVYKRSIASLPPVIDGRYTITLPENNIFGRDYKEGFKQPRLRGVEGVIVAASTTAHHEIAVYLLQNGFRYILIEKPLTKTYTQAKELQTLLQKFPETRAMVGHTLLYDPAYQLMKKAAASKIGMLWQIHYTSLKAPPIAGDTIIPDAGSPPIYLFLDMAGGKPTTISARPTEHDNIELIIDFDSRVQGIAHIGTQYPERKREIALRGEKGTLVLNEFMDPRELLYVDTSGRREHLDFSKTYTALQLEILEFVACVTQKEEPKTPLAEGVEVVKLIELAEQSYKKGGEPIPCVYENSI